MKSKWCSQEFCAQPQLQASLSQLVANFVPDDPLARYNAKRDFTKTAEPAKRSVRAAIPRHPARRARN